jgi:membrane associated rhomboid family serine protease
MFYRPLTPIVKNLLIINVIMFVASMALGDGFSEMMAGHYITSELFKPWQILTHMFMHAGFTHILFNMIGVYFFGTYLEDHWGGKRFLTYYLLTGLGAFFLHFLIIYLRIQQVEPLLTPEQIATVYSEAMANLNDLLNRGVVGASGALFGLLIAFGLIFPNVRLMLLFPPIPIKARTLALGYGAIELYLALSHPGDNVAHFAHLGGMLFGYIILKYWQKRGNIFY